MLTQSKGELFAMQIVSPIAGYKKKKRCCSWYWKLFLLKGSIVRSSYKVQGNSWNDEMLLGKFYCRNLFHFPFSVVPGKCQGDKFLSDGSKTKLRSIREQLYIAGFAFINSWDLYADHPTVITLLPTLRTHNVGTVSLRSVCIWRWPRLLASRCQ